MIASDVRKGSLSNAIYFLRDGVLAEIADDDQDLQAATQPSLACAREPNGDLIAMSDAS
jgi:hypothetical protein